jgi:hypothetical protein
MSTVKVSILNFCQIKHSIFTLLLIIPFADDVMEEPVEESAHLDPQVEPEAIGTERLGEVTTDTIDRLDTDKQVTYEQDGALTEAPYASTAKTTDDAEIRASVAGSIGNAIDAEHIDTTAEPGVDVAQTYKDDTFETLAANADVQEAPPELLPDGLQENQETPETLEDSQADAFVQPTDTSEKLRIESTDVVETSVEEATAIEATAAKESTTERSAFADSMPPEEESVENREYGESEAETTKESVHIEDPTTKQDDVEQIDDTPHVPSQEMMVEQENIEFIEKMSADESHAEQPKATEQYSAEIAIDESETHRAKVQEEVEPPLDELEEQLVEQVSSEVQVKEEIVEAAFESIAEVPAPTERVKSENFENEEQSEAEVTKPDALEAATTEDADFAMDKPAPLPPIESTSTPHSVHASRPHSSKPLPAIPNTNSSSSRPISASQHVGGYAPVPPISSRPVSGSTNADENKAGSRVPSARKSLPDLVRKTSAPSSRPLSGAIKPLESPKSKSQVGLEGLDAATSVEQSDQQDNQPIADMASTSPSPAEEIETEQAPGSNSRTPSKPATPLRGVSHATLEKVASKPTLSKAGSKNVLQQQGSRPQSRATSTAHLEASAPATERSKANSRPISKAGSRKLLSESRPNSRSTSQTKLISSDEGSTLKTKSKSVSKTNSKTHLSQEEEASGVPRLPSLPTLPTE